MTKSGEKRPSVNEAITAALADLERLPDSEERYRAATRLVDQLAEAMITAGRLRARAAVQLRAEESLSLAQLGRRLGLSKARASDIVRDFTRNTRGHPG